VVGHFLGYGRGSDNSETAWTTAQSNNVTSVVKAGLSAVYFCGINWSFLTPVATLALASGESTTKLPDDYGGHVSNLIVSISGGASVCKLQFGPITPVHMAEAAGTNTGMPQMACIEPIKGTTPLGSSRMQIHVWPTAEQDYILTLRYYLNPDYLSGSLPYAYGGPQHRNLLREACLAQAEIEFLPTSERHRLEFERLLPIAKQLDDRNKPTNLGLNLDRSDGSRWSRAPRGDLAGSVVTFNGVEYS
jgi:hypothetical protein